MAGAGMASGWGGRVPGEPPTDLDAALRHALFGRSPLGIAVFDTDLRYRAVNDALLKINGVTEDDLIGRRIGEVLPDLDAAGIEAAMRRVLETGEPLDGELTRGRTLADPGREHVWSVAYYRLDSADGEPIGLTAVLSDVTREVEARESATRAQQRLALVSEASVRLGASLELRRIGRELVELAVPRFADHVIVDVVEEVFRVEGEAPAPRAAWLARDAPRERMMRRLALGHAAPALAAGCPLAAPGVTLDYPDGTPGARALETGRAVLVPRVEDALDDDGLPPDSVAWARRVGVRSQLVAPLVARGRLLGAAVFLTSVSGRVYDEDDRALAVELATRAALAIDNARLYAQERAAAVTLQRSLLPQDLPVLTGVDIATRYLPGAVGTEVGGDWFDVIPLTCGRVAFVVGDVMGRGLRAAAAMGQLRTAVRTLATLDLLPGDALMRLDDLAQSLDQVQLATCVYAVYEPQTGGLCYASAGHLPLVVVPERGAPALAHVPSGAPLGVGGVAFDTAETHLDDGAVLCLYTDGLVESRTQSLQEGLDALLNAMADPPESLGDACDSVLAALGRDVAHDDDIAMLLVRLRGAPEGTVRTQDVTASTAAPGRARRFVREVLRDWQLPALVETATLLVSELVTNALRYAHAPMQLRVSRLPGTLCLEVADRDTRLPRRRHAGTWDEGGRGLELVAELSERWGTRPTATGKVVWCELPLHRAGPG